MSTSLAALDEIIEAEKGVEETMKKLVRSSVNSTCSISLFITYFVDKVKKMHVLKRP